MVRLERHNDKLRVLPSSNKEQNFLVLHRLLHSPVELLNGGNVYLVDTLNQIARLDTGLGRRSPGTTEATITPSPNE